ncbi:MFS general substrate transporter [Hysterangium stoloniferum]|nr:MFS general substrate transporter [Hysterangium stoloniferum]
MSSPTPDSRLSSQTNHATSVENIKTGEHVVDGGLNGWMTVIGSWLVLFSTLGYAYSFGVYQDYYTRVFLTSQSPSSIAWMGSAQLALSFAMGLVAGKLFDAGHLRLTMTLGSFIFLFSLFMLSLAKPDHYYEVFLSQGLGMGIGIGLLFTPASAIVGHHFKRRRSLAYGTAMSGSSIGAVVFPITLNHLLPRVGFADSVRITAYISLGSLVLGNVLIRPVRIQRSGARPDIKGFFTDLPYMAFVVGTAFAALGLFFPVVYIQLYSVQHSVGKNLAFYSVAIVNGSGVLGRIVANHLADMYGVWNIHLAMTFVTGAMIWAVLGVSDSASLIVVGLLYGISSGAWLSLLMVALSTLANSPQEIGARMGIGLAFISVAVLGSAPIQGALLSSDFNWLHAVAFSGSMMFVAAGIHLVMRLRILSDKPMALA